MPPAAGTIAIPRPGRLGGEVRRPDDANRIGQVRADLLPPPGVVAERDRVGADREQLLGELGRDPDAVGDVLAVDDAEVDAELAAETGQALGQRLAAGSADDVADEEDPQRGPPPTATSRPRG